MTLNEFLQSGLVEAYCLGLVSDEEVRIVQEYSEKYREVQSEIDLVNKSLAQHAYAFSKEPPFHLKDKVLQRLRNLPQQSEAPPSISKNSTVNEWINYLERNQIHTSPEFNFAEIREIDLRDGITTYIAWASKEALVEESHSDEDEYLFMLSGSCSITFNDKINYYKKGDFIFVPHNTFHSAKATSDELMTLIGQRKIINI